MKKKYKILLYVDVILIFVLNFPIKSFAIGGADIAIVGQAVMDQTVFSQIALMGADASGLSDPIKIQKSPTQSMVDWIQGEFDNWRARQYLTWGTVLTVAANGARYLSDGRILLNDELSDLYQRFYNWLWDGEDGPNLKDDAEVIPSEGEGFGVNIPSDFDRSTYLYYPTVTYNIAYSTSGSTKYQNATFNYTTSGGYITALSNGNSNLVQVYCFSPSNSGIMTRTNDGYTYQTVHSYPSKNGTSIYWSYTTTGNGMTDPTMGRTTVYNGSTPGNIDGKLLADIGYLIFNYGYQIGEDQILGDPNKLGGLNGEQADTNILAPPDLFSWGPDFGGNGGYIDINDYLGGIADGIENGEGTIDVTTEVEGVDTTVAESFTYDNTADMDVTQELAEEIQGTIEDVADQTTVDSLEPYTLDLKDFFPFCIPFDLYDMLTLFSASPVAPNVNYRFYVPGVVDQNISLDLSEFDSVAAVLRNAELLAAAIGLALMTKKLIQGGD